MKSIPFTNKSCNKAANISVWDLMKSSGVTKKASISSLGFVVILDCRFCLATEGNISFVTKSDSVYSEYFCRLAVGYVLCVSTQLAKTNHGSSE